MPGEGREMAVGLFAGWLHGPPCCLNWVTLPGLPPHRALCAFVWGTRSVQVCDVQLPCLQPPVAPVLCSQGADLPQAWDCFGRVRPCCSFGTTLLAMRDQCAGSGQCPITRTGTPVCTSCLAVLCLSFPWDLFSPGAPDATFCWSLQDAMIP